MRRGRIGFWMRLAVVVIKPFVTLLTRRRWRGGEHVPAQGPVIIATNHISYLDPFTVAHFVYDTGRLPRFMAKDTLFTLPIAGRIVRGAGQIPVHRYTEHAVDALASAVAALDRGECVVVYPEGTVTRDPAYWPMRARTGVARLALRTGAPVVPVAQWGAQAMLGRDHRLHLLPRHRIDVLAGPPIDLSAYRTGEPTGRTFREATDVVMMRLRDMLGDIRGEQPPESVFDPRAVLPVDDVRRPA